MTLAVILEEEEGSMNCARASSTSFQMTLETLIDAMIGYAIMFSLYKTSIISLTQLFALCIIFASIRAPALMQKLRSKYCPQQQNIDAFLNLMKKRLTDAQNQLDQAAVAKHYQNASRRVKSSVRFALMRLSELKVQASVSLTRTISKIDKKQKLAKIYGSACESALTMGSLMRKRFDANKYRAFLSLRSALLRLDANIKSKVGLVTLEQYVQKSICEKEADAAKLRKYAVVQSCVSGITRSETGYSLLCLGILAAVGTGARIIMRSHQRR